MQNYTFAKTFALPFKVAPLESVTITFFLLINLITSPLQILITALFLDRALAAAIQVPDGGSVIFPFVLLVAMTLYGYITEPIYGLCRTSMSQKVNRHIQEPFFEKRARLEYKHIEDTKTVDLLDRIQNNAFHNLSSMMTSALWFVSWIVGIGSGFVILLVNAPLAGVIIIALLIPVIYIGNKSGKEEYEVTKEHTLDTRYTWNIGWVLTSRDTVSERSMFGYFGHLMKKFEYYVERERKQRLEVGLRRNFRMLAASSMLTFASVMALVVMVPSVASGALSVGLFIALQAVLFNVAGNISWGLNFYVSEFIKKREFLKEVNQYFALSEATDAEALPATPAPTFEKLEFKDVSFTYPGTDKVVLRNTSFVIEKGRHYAFVGVNGAGKTTITKLMTKLYDDYTGEILLNGKSLREWSLPDIKACFCALFQDFNRYDITVRENVSIGKINCATEEEIDKALELSGFDMSTAELPKGKDTLIGKTHEGSVDLSGGQWQRLAFARAMVNPAPIKILDEPTAALDPIAESELYAKFESISRGFTTIFISHRLASAKMASTIFVLDGGKVAELGNHNELIKLGGLYAEMYESQRSWYT